LRPKDNAPMHASAQQLATHFSPRYGGRGILLMLGPATVKFRTLLGRELQCALALDLTETLPECERDLRPIVRWKLEEL
jgi:hypothetical protein